MKAPVERSLDCIHAFVRTKKWCVRRSCNPMGKRCVGRVRRSEMTHKLYSVPCKLPKMEAKTEAATGSELAAGTDTDSHQDAPATPPPGRPS